MDIFVKIDDLNSFLKASKTKLSLRGVGERVIEIKYNPLLLPSISLRLELKEIYESNLILFYYTTIGGASSFMVSAANFLSAFPEGIEVDECTGKQRLWVSLNKLESLVVLGNKLRIKYLDIHKDSVGLGLFIAE